MPPRKAIRIAPEQPITVAEMMQEIEVRRAVLPAAAFAAHRSDEIRQSDPHAQQHVSSAIPNKFSSFPDAIYELQKSHSQLTRRLSAIEHGMVNMTRAMDIDKAAQNGEKAARETYAFRRTQLFARITACKMLTSVSPELSRSNVVNCAETSVRQIILKSRPSDCTLEEFRAFVAECLRDNSISCVPFPSEYYLMFCDGRRAIRFSLIFETYSDFCESLAITVNIREVGIYKEQENSARDLRAIQVLGAECTSGDGTSTSGSQRKILLGRGISCDLKRAAETSYLFQENTNWIETTWEKGFTLQREPTDDLIEHIRPTTSTNPTADKRMSDINQDHPDPRTFSVV